MKCESCETFAKSPVPGVLYPCASNSDSSRLWVERCDECERFDSDEDAARAVIAAGIGVNIGSAVPVGLDYSHPFIILRMNKDEQLGDEFFNDCTSGFVAK